MPKTAVVEQEREAPAAVAGRDVGTLMQVPLELLREAPWNARSDFGGQAELVASIREEGILVPLRARPINDQDVEGYEVFCGHRRLRAARAIGLAEVPVLIRPCEDQEARSLAVIDNLQREGLGPMDEAKAFGELAKLGLATAEIAARCVPERAQGVAYVHTRLALLELPEDVQDQVRAGKLPLAVAAAILRLAAPLRARAAKAVATEATPGASVKELLTVVTELMLPLKGAQFDPSDTTLVPQQGACHGCQYRTGNQGSLFGPTSNDDVCTNSACYRAKLDETFRRRADAHHARGGKVFDPKAAAKLFPYKNNPDYLLNDYVAVTDDIYAGGAGRTSVKAALAFAGDKAPKVLLAQSPHSGRVVELVPRAEAMKLAASMARSKDAKARAGDVSKLTKAEIAERMRRQKEALRVRVDAQAMHDVAAEVVVAAEESWARVLLKAPNDVLGGLHALARVTLDSAGHEARVDATLRREWAEKRAQADYEAFEEHVARMSATQALALAAEVYVWQYRHSLFDAGRAEDSAEHQLLESLGVDPKAIRAEVERVLRLAHQEAVSKQAQKAAAKAMREGGRGPKPKPKSAAKPKAKRG